jgi:hypothetical protein
MTKINTTGKVLIISAASLVGILLILLGAWWGMVRAVPSYVNDEYNVFASDTHLQASLSYCLSGPERVYMVKALYAEKNIDIGGSVGYAVFFTDTTELMSPEGDSYYGMVDLDPSGNITDPNITYGSCVPLMWEWEKATP